MKKSFFIGFVALVLQTSGAHAQNDYYYKGAKVNLTIDKNDVYLLANEGFIGSSNANELFQQFNIELSDGIPIDGMFKVHFNSVPDMKKYTEIVGALQGNAQIKHVFPFFERGGGAAPIGTSYVFYLKLKQLQAQCLPAWVLHSGLGSKRPSGWCKNSAKTIIIKPSFS